MKKIGYYYKVSQTEVNQRVKKGLLPKDDPEFFWTGVVVEEGTDIQAEARRHVPPGMVFRVEEYPYSSCQT